MLPMKKMIKLFFLICLATFFPSATFADVSVQPKTNIKISKSIPLYDEVKYTDNFTHFQYTNPQAPKSGRIVLPAYGGFDNFNPYIFKGIASTETLLLTLETLGTTPADDPTTVYPLIAKEFELPDDKSFVGFIIDERAKFSNGTPITADDIIFSFTSIVEKGAPIYKVYYSDVESVEKINDKHVRFMFKHNNNRELPLIISQIHIFSKADWEGKDFDKTYLTPPLGSGPYLVDKFETGKYIVFKRNNNHWGKSISSNRGFYNFDEIRFDYYQDTTVTLQALFSQNIDARTEYIAKNWVTAYDNDLIKSGKIIKAEIEHSRAATLQNFSFNIRKDKFKDKRVRQAIGLAFNFDWANENLFYNQYKRINSYFTNTEMEATGIPEGKELEILNKYKDKLDADIFTTVPNIPSSKNTIENRNNLRTAVKLLNDAGYDFVDGKMTNLATNEPLEFEVFSNSANGAVFTRVMLPFIDNLKKIGIKATFRNLEINVFKNRLDNFDFDMAILSFGVSQTPGNEQREYWGSQSAHTKGSYNKIGIENPIVDELITGLINAEHKDEYKAYVQALDRVLRNEHYIIPQWYSPFDRVAYWNKFGTPQTNIKVGFQPYTWWIKGQEMENKKILALGDSIVEGYNDDNFLGWAGRVENKFIEDNKNYSIINSGHAGKTTCEMPSFLKEDLREHGKPDIIIISIGINDLFIGFAGDDERYKSEAYRLSCWDNLLNEAQKTGAKIVVTDILPVNFGAVLEGYNYSFNQKVEEYNSNIKTICQGKNIPFFSRYEQWKTRDLSNLYDDVIHPNSKGHQIIADEIYSELIKLGFIE